MAKKIDDDVIEKLTYGYTVETSQIEEENKILKQTVDHLKSELKKFQTPPLMVAEVKEALDDNYLIRLNNGNEFYVTASAGIGKLMPGDAVLVEQKNLTISKKINNSTMFNVEKFVIVEKPRTSWTDIGGLDQQVAEIKEVIELPLKKPELFKKVGITPPKGILLHGPPGTGKTLLAKAVAASTNSTFIEVVGSELVQKFIGEGAKLIKEIFQLARAKAPSIIFIDEIDALAAKRIEMGTSGEREVQRTFMQFLAEIDGFKHLDNVKIIGCTNRKEILDPAVIRPGRLDRLIHVPAPNLEGIKQIFKIHTSKMKLSKISVDDICKKMEGFSGAEIRAACTEAGYFAIRKGKTTVSKQDFESAVEKVMTAEQTPEGKEFLGMFG
jgi:proteasome regulatory subunit